MLKRAKHKRYAGQWRMVAGKVEGCEKAWQGGLRELREETGLFPTLYWAAPTINQFYEPVDDAIHKIPAFAAQISPLKSITLNDEHSECRWIQKEQIKEYISWPEQHRILMLIHKILTQQTILDDWKIAL